MRDLENITYKWKNYRLTFYHYHGDAFINVECELDGKTYSRSYEIYHTISSLDIEGEYVYLNYNDSGLTGYNNDNQYVIKFEYDSCLVIDTFDSSGNHIECIGSWDFKDEVLFNDKI